MSDVKKDHNIGSGAGAMGGAIAGAAIGSAAGPAGSAVGAVVGGLVGAKAGDSLAEVINPTEYAGHFEKEYRTSPYYISGSEWRDYQPAYQYSYDNYSQYRGQPFEKVEPELQRNWEASRAESRLAWNDARDAVRDGWHYIERAMPGDADNDGR